MKNGLYEIAQGVPSNVTVPMLHPNNTKAIFVVTYDDAQPLNKGRITLWRTQKADYGTWRVKSNLARRRRGRPGW